MAEGVDNDMSEQRREQASVPHGQEAVRSSQVKFAIPATNLQTGVPVQPTLTVSGNTTALYPGPIKKKSSFQITSVTESKIHNRGDSNGYDGELDLNESDVVEEVEVELEPVPDPATANGNGASRFKVVRIQRNESYVRGRWKCHDFPDAESTQSSSTSVSTSSSTSISAHQSRDSVDRTDSHSSTKTSITSNSIGNHIASDTEIQSSSETHGSVVKSTSTTQANEHSSISGEAFVPVKKKDSEPRLGVAVELVKQSDSSVAKVSPAIDNVDRISLEGAQSIVASASVGAIEAEMPIVNKIASAMEQITQIKSDLLSVVNKEVQTLKETISKLTEENLELKLENEKLRNLVEFKNSTST